MKIGVAVDVEITSQFNKHLDHGSQTVKQDKALLTELSNNVHLRYL